MKQDTKIVLQRCEPEYNIIEKYLLFNEEDKSYDSKSWEKDQQHFKKVKI